MKEIIQAIAFEKLFPKLFKIPTADLPPVYNWEEYSKEKLWLKFRWQYMNKDGEFKDLPGRKASNGNWPCLDEFIDDHWLSQGKKKILFNYVTKTFFLGTNNFHDNWFVRGVRANIFQVSKPSLDEISSNTPQSDDRETEME